MLLIPSQALIDTGNDSGWCRVHADGRFLPKRVAVFGIARRHRITLSLAEGEKVVFRRPVPD
ncbi:hypothetical protein ACULNC_08455 [Shigella flexneri]